MKYILSLVIFFIGMGQLCLAQTHTSFLYMSKEGKETTKDSAFTYIVLYKHDNLWHGKEYFSRNPSLKSEGDYTEKNCATPVGNFQNYKEDGTLDNTASYDNGKLLEKTYYYKSGNKKSHIAYSSNGIAEQKGWDEKGQEIPGYIVEREARFKDGAKGWQKYLENHLNSSVVADAGAPAGDYVVEVEFVVNKEGNISNVKATSVPPKCKPCAAEAVSVVMNGPAWEPAIQNNEPVIYRQKQNITFEVIGKKGRNN